jgi:hypothetical protein
MNRYEVPIYVYTRSDERRLYATLEVESPDPVDAQRVATNWLAAVHFHRTDLLVDAPVSVPTGRVLSTTYHE